MSNIHNTLPVPPPSYGDNLLLEKQHMMQRVMVAVVAKIRTDSGATTTLWARLDKKIGRLVLSGRLDHKHGLWPNFISTKETHEERQDRINALLDRAGYELPGITLEAVYVRLDNAPVATFEGKVNAYFDQD